MGRPSHTRRAAARAAGFRRSMTISEARVWEAIRGKATGARFRRQTPIGPFIADFACLSPRLVVEIDGLSHERADETVRTEYLQGRGFTVLRFDNEMVAKHLDDVFETIRAVVEDLRE
ncbi:MAG TPA: endonuclease domain-containing protein [Acidimicrobiia bacterium]|nr:endonuclease domain-containing protein [Acidimicrobiia bacterium]